jgi:hypothetical protein
MMKKPLNLLLAVVLAALLGCVPSLNPFYTEKDLIFSQKLLGVWTEGEDSKDTWTFTRDGDRGYKLVITEDDMAAAFTARLFRIGGHDFLDLFPDKTILEEWKRPVFFKSALIRAHLVIRVSSMEPDLQMSVLDIEWLGKLLEREPKAVQHQKTSEDDFFLTAPTLQLQQFLLKHLQTEGAWGEKPSVWKRKIEKTEPARP